jgi:hypothetical protein
VPGDRLKNTCFPGIFLGTRIDEIDDERKGVAMRSFLASVIAGFAIAVAGGFQTPTAKPKPIQTPPDVTVRGCVLQGSGPTVFIVDNARKDPKSTTEKGVRYVLVPGTEDLMLRAHVNHLVEMTGQIAAKPAPRAGQPVTEKDLSTLTVKSLTMVADTCRGPK